MGHGLINSPELYEAADIPEDKKDRLRVTGKELAIGVDYDRIDASYPSSIQEIYTYTKNGATVLSLEVNYVTASKKDIASVIVL